MRDYTLNAHLERNEAFITDLSQCAIVEPLGPHIVSIRLIQVWA